LRIDGPSPSQGASYAAPSRSAGVGGRFTVEAEAQPSRAAANAPVMASAGLETLLALQAVDDLRLTRRKAIRRGHQMLDALDEMKVDLLAGRVSEGRLNQLLSLVGQAREGSVAGLDSLLDDLELRVRVELAKFGRYTTV
jgi:hypothetical protein